MQKYQVVFYIIDVYCESFYIDTYFMITYALIYSSKFWQHLNHGQEKRSNRQNPGPSERTSQDQNFANNQLKGTVTTSFDAKLSDINKFVKPACPTASLAHQIDHINSRWLQDITESLVSHIRERIDNFKRHLSTFWLDHSDCEKGQTLEKMDT